MVTVAEVFSINEPEATHEVAVSLESTRAHTHAAGNVGGGSGTHTHTVDVTAPAPSITVNAITADNIVNASESGEIGRATCREGGWIWVGDVAIWRVEGKKYMRRVRGLGRCAGRV